MPISRSPEYKSYLKLLRERLPDPKVSHCIFVAEYVSSLAEEAGFDHDKGVAAGLLHDLCRTLDNDEMLRRARGFSLPISEAAEKKPNLLHGPVAAMECRSRLDIDDEVFDAIFHHTTGRPNWTRLGMALYLADFSEPNRTYEEAKVCRDILRAEGFEEAILHAARCRQARLQKKDVVEPVSGAFFLWLEEELG